jgi:L-malate glycosyltransferase
LRWIVNKTASKIIFVSNTLKAQEEFKNKKQVVVYNALSKLFLEQATVNKYNSIDEKDNFNIYMIASLRDYKGVNEFVEIAQKCLKNNALKFTLVLNASQIEINEFFKNIVLPNNINIFPTQQCLHKHYKKASLLLNLSRIDQWVETFGLTILEAMAYGIPVIAPPVGGPSEIVDDYVEGYLISSYNTDQIVNKIEELFKDNSLCMRLSKNAKLKSKKFDEATFNEQIIELLND